MDAIKHPYQGHHMEPAFLGFVSYALNNRLDEFEAECGPINIGVTAMDRAIDKATGHEVAMVQRFVDWCVCLYGAPEQIEDAEDV